MPLEQFFTLKVTAEDTHGDELEIVVGHNEINFTHYDGQEFTYFLDNKQRKDLVDSLQETLRIMSGEKVPVTAERIRAWCRALSHCRNEGDSGYTELVEVSFFDDGSGMFTRDDEPLFEFADIDDVNDSDVAFAVQWWNVYVDGQEVRHYNTGNTPEVLKSKIREGIVAPPARWKNYAWND